MPQTQDSALDTLLRATSTNVLAWFATENLLPSGETATRFLDHQTWMSAVRLVSAADPLIHVCVNLVRSLLPDDADALGELLHVQLARVCASGWVGSRSTREEDVALGITAELRNWLIERKEIGQLPPVITITALAPGPTASSVQLQADAITSIVMAGVDRHLNESRANAYLLKLNRIRSSLGITAAELAPVEMLLRYFQPEHLPSVMRRPIAALNNDTPIDWLASRRFDELAAFFAEKFNYGTTA